MNTYLDDELNVPRSEDHLGLLDFERIVHTAQPKRHRKGILKAVLILAPIGLIGTGAAALLMDGNMVKGEGVPLIVADATPIKERPEQPGGMQVPHQDKTVFTRAGMAKTDQQQITVLPDSEKPVPIPKLAPAPLAPKKYGSVSPEDPNSSENRRLASFQPAVLNYSASQLQPTRSVGAPEQPMVENATTLPGTTRQPTGVTVKERQPVLAEAPVPTQPSSVEAKTDVAPPGRQEDEAFREVAVVVPKVVKNSAPAMTESRSIGKSKGRWMVQIAAVGSPSEAQAYWSSKNQIHPNVLGDLDLVVQKTVKNGTTYFRVRGGGFKAKSAARKRCLVAKSEGLDCIVVAMD